MGNWSPREARTAGPAMPALVPQEQQKIPSKWTVAKEEIMLMLEEGLGPLQRDLAQGMQEMATSLNRSLTLREQSGQRDYRLKQEWKQTRTSDTDLCITT